jgi:hypothetical protein
LVALAAAYGTHRDQSEWGEIGGEVKPFVPRTSGPCGRLLGSMTISMMRPAGKGRGRPPSASPPGWPRYVYGLSIALAAVAGATAGLTYVFGGLLRGPAVMNGSCRGTALVMLVVGVPVLTGSLIVAAQGSHRAVFVWFGASLYLAYNSFLLTVATPLNRLFLFDVTALALSIATAVAVAAAAQPRVLALHVKATLPAHGLAAFLWAVVGLNAAAWLRRIVPALVDNDPARLLRGTGITVVPTYLEDLAFWLPLVAVAGVWLWRRLPWGYLLAGGALAFWALEGLTVAVDQWFGHRADPASDVASAGAVVPFLAAAAVGAFVLWVFLREVRD